MSYDIDPKTKRYLNWTLAVIVLIILAFWFFGPDLSVRGGTSHSPTYTPALPGQWCAGHLEVVKPLSGGTQLVCVFP